MAKYARTNELETYWTHYNCVDQDCPGKNRKQDRPYTDKTGWIRLGNGRKRKKTLDADVDALG